MKFPWFGSKKQVAEDIPYDAKSLKGTKDKKKKNMAIMRALSKARETEQAAMPAFATYEPPPGVLPSGKEQTIMGMDSTPYDYIFNNMMAGYADYHFPGYPVLATLAQLPEYRKISETIAKEMTRKWIVIKAGGGDEDKTDKVNEITQAFEHFKIQQVFRKAAELDGLFGRAQVYIDVKKPGGSDARKDPAELQTRLTISPSKLKKGCLNRLTVVEPVWTYPGAYNARDPLDPDYYNPQEWYVMGKTVHTSRLLSFVAREVPDLLKASYNFGGLSMTQIAKPYVENWTRTRDSVGDMIHAFSISGLATDLAALLSGDDDADFFERADLFNAMRDNRNLMLLDKETEEFFQFNTPLSGLSDLQAQAQEQMSSVASIPLVKLLGVTPSGLNASSEGEITVFYDFIHSYQEHLYTDPLNTVLQVVQYHLYGEVDPDITFEFVPLHAMTDKEKADVQKVYSETDQIRIDSGTISADEARNRLSEDPDSGYTNITVNDPEGEEDPELSERHVSSGGPAPGGFGGAE